MDPLTATFPDSYNVPIKILYKATSLPIREEVLVYVGNNHATCINGSCTINIPRGSTDPIIVMWRGKQIIIQSSVFNTGSALITLYWDKSQEPEPLPEESQPVAAPVAPVKQEPQKSAKQAQSSPTRTARKPFTVKPKWQNLKALLPIAIVAVAVLAVALIIITILSAVGTKGNQQPAQQPEVQSTEIVVPPTSSADTVVVVPPATQESKDVNPWFLASGEPTAFRVIYSLPANLSDFLNFGRHIGWILNLFAIGIVLWMFAGESDDRAARSDFDLVVIGIGIFAFAVFFGNAIALQLNEWVAWTVGPDPASFQFTGMLIMGLGGAIALGFSVGASLSKPRDFTPLSAGMIMMGTILKTFTAPLPEVILFGTILQVLGIAVHVGEIARHKPDRVKAFVAVLATGVLSIGFGILVLSGIGLLAGTQYNPSLISFYATVYQLRFIITYIAIVLSGCGIISMMFRSRKIPEALQGREGPVGWIVNVVSASDSIRIDVQMLYAVIALFPVMVGWIR